MFDKTARQKWLRENAERLAELYGSFIEAEPAPANDAMYEEWIVLASVFSAQFSTRANLYDEPAIMQASSDAALREAVIEVTHSNMLKMKGKIAKAEKAQRAGKLLSDDEIQRIHKQMCWKYELDFIFKSTISSEGSNGLEQG